MLADGWLYPSWVVGASRMREVDVKWPASRSRIHHSVGVWPALIDDHTKVLESIPGTAARFGDVLLPDRAAVPVERIPPRFAPSQGLLGLSHRAVVRKRATILVAQIEAPNRKRFHSSGRRDGDTLKSPGPASHTLSV